MCHNDMISRASHRGFTLIETLVALAVASTLIAALIPISRNTLFRIVSYKDEALRLALLQSLIVETDIVSASNLSGSASMMIDTAVKTLPPFDVDKDQNFSWQPVLVTIEVKSASGGITRTELIRLERTER